MSEGEGIPKRSKIARVRKYAAGVKDFMGVYLDFESDLAEVKKQPIPQDVLDAYNQNREAIEQIYGRETQGTYLFHGTGKLQYAGDKYKEGVAEEVRYPLDTILKEGLKPHHDVWNSAEDGYESSSLATTWFYARVYADFHQSPDDPLKWEYGDKADWLRYFLAVTGAKYVKKGLKTNITSPRTFIRNLKKDIDSLSATKTEGDLGRLQKWVSYVRRSKPTDRSADIFKSRTDIPGNFGAVFTVDPRGVSIAPRGPGVYEVRTFDAISPDHFVALSVPLHTFEEYKKRVSRLEWDLPVLPTEAVEYHMSRLSFSELTSNRQVISRQK